MSIGIDLGQSAIKVVELRAGLGKVKLAGVSRKRIGRGRADYRTAVPQILGDGLGRHLSGKRAIVGVSGRDVNLQIQMFPGTKLTNYPAMVRNEIATRRGESTDLYIDHTTLRRPDQYFPFYLTAFGIAKNEFIDERMAIVQSVGVTPLDVIPTPFALMAAYRYGYGTEGGVVMLLNIGSDNIDMVLVRGGKLIFARNISQGARIFDEQVKTMVQVGDEEAEAQKIKYGTLGPGGQGTPADTIRPAIRQAAYQLVGLLQSTLMYAKTQLDDKELQVDKVYVSGGGARISGLDTYLKSALKADIEWLDPFLKVDTSLAKSSGEEEISSLPSDLAIAVGLAHIGNERHRHPILSLVPDRMRQRRNFLSTVPFMVGACVILVVTLAAITFTMKSQEDQLAKAAQSMTAIAKRLETDQRTLDGLESEYRLIYAKFDLLQNQTVTSRGVMDTYAKLRRLGREGIQIEKVDLKDAGPVKRAIVNVPDQGHVSGTYLSEDEEHIVLKESGPLKKGDKVEWEAVNYRMTISGEIEENIKGGANETLLDMKRQLTDSASGATAEITKQDASPRRPGWRAFSIEVRFQ